MLCREISVLWLAGAFLNMQHVTSEVLPGDAQ